METTNIYILFFPDAAEIGAIKIGKADDLWTRLPALEKSWGFADYSASLYAAIKKRDIWKLEDSIHFILRRYAIKFDSGTGRSEMFSQGALPLAASCVEAFSGHLKKPVPPQHIRSPGYLRLVNAGRDFREPDSSIDRGFHAAATTFRQINKLVISLKKDTHGIRYQYDISATKVYFRVKGMHDYLSFHDLFSFDIYRFGRYYFLNCCDVYQLGDVFQYEVDMNWQPLSRIYRYQKPLFFDAFKRTRRLLDRLPRRSTSLEVDLPILDRKNSKHVASSRNY